MNQSLKTISKSNKGFSSLYLLIIVGLIAISSAGYFGYKNFNNLNPIDTTTEPVTTPIKDESKGSDKDTKLKEIENLKASNQGLLIENASLKNQIKSLNESLKSKDKTISEIKDDLKETKNDTKEINKKISCLELIKKTPQRGNVEHINIDIVKFYKFAVEDLNSMRSNAEKSENPDDFATDIKRAESIVNEAKPMYDEYIKKCD